MSYFIGFWKGYVDFKSKADKKTFWLTILAAVIFEVIVATVVGIIFGIIAGVTNNPGVSSVASVLISLLSLAMLLPEVALIIRRYNDVGQNWKYIFWLLCPIAGIILTVIKCLQPSASGTVETTATEEQQQ